MKKIFLISGLAQHGKDSTANILSKKLGDKSLILHNADYLKFIAKEYMKWNGNKDELGRTLLQTLGTEKVRLQLNKPLFWTNIVCDTIEILQDYYDYFFIPDTRYENEIYYPQARFPNQIITIRIYRFNFISPLTPKQQNHISEISLKDFKHDFYINSKSGLDNLEFEIDRLLSTDLFQLKLLGGKNI